jgi:hypothetical protein
MTQPNTKKKGTSNRKPQKHNTIMSRHQKRKREHHQEHDIPKQATERIWLRGKTRTTERKKNYKRKTTKVERHIQTDIQYKIVTPRNFLFPCHRRH